VALKAVFLDVGETLVDEQRYWRAISAALGLPPHVVCAALGVTIARGEHHRRLYDHLGVEPPASLPVYVREDFYPDALPCLGALRRAGYLIGVAGNQSAELEDWFRSEGIDVDVVASSARWGVEKPSPQFFARMVESVGCEAGEVAYVGDRVDNDVVPARRAGLVAVYVRRGPWGLLQAGAEQAHIRLDSLAELPDALAAHA